MSATLIWLSMSMMVCGLDKTPSPPTQADADAQTLRAAKVAIDGPRLLDFFRRQIPTLAKQKRLQKLIDDLGSDHFEVRERASEALVHLGPAALFALRRAANSTDLEVRLRALRCIESLHADLTVATAAARMLRRVRLPDETLTVLLAYLPYTPNIDIEEELLTTLVVVGVEHGRARPAILASLTDKEPSRRAAAALIVGRLGTEEQKRRVHALLTDLAPEVRLRAAQGLLATGEKQAIPVLLALLDRHCSQWPDEADFLLELAAGVKVQTLSQQWGTGRRNREVWERWWREQQVQIDLSRIVSTLRKQLEQLRGLRSAHESNWRRYQELERARAIDHAPVERAARLVRDDNLAITRTRRFLLLWGVQPAHRNESAEPPSTTGKTSRPAR